MRLVAIALAIASFAAADPARANGRYPAAGQLVVDPLDADHLVVRGTFGFVTSRDRGQTWSWICEGSVGYGGEQDPAIALTGDGSLLAGVFEGLAVSRDECSWRFAGGALEAQFVIDVSTEKQNPTRAVAITATPQGGGNFVSQLWSTTDHGDTWQLAGTLDPTLNLLTVDVAPSDPQRIYASGIQGGTGASIIARSDNAGATWSYLPIPATEDAIGPFLSAIDPTNPDVLYIRLRAFPTDRLLVSKDGAGSWTTRFQSMGSLLAFALSPDGSRVALGGAEDGIWTAPTNTQAFTKVSPIGPQCLTWTQEGLYACADEDQAQFTIGHSKDGAATFQPIMHLAGICGILTCNPETSVAKICPAEWPLVAESLATKEPCEASDGNNNDPSTASSTGDGPHNPPNDDPTNNPTRPQASGCSTNPNPPSLPLGCAAALALALTRPRRRPQTTPHASQQ